MRKLLPQRSKKTKEAQRTNYNYIVKNMESQESLGEEITMSAGAYRLSSPDR